MKNWFKCTNLVLVLLCAMYFITYIVRQSVSTAMLDIRPEFGLSNTEALFIFSVFGYPYLLFQIIGGMTADRFGPRKTLFVSGLVWAGATVVTGLATGFATLVLARVVMGFGVGATLPDRDAGDAALGRVAQTRLCPGHHPCLLAPRKCAHARYDCGADGGIHLAWFICSDGPDRLRLGRGLVVVFPRRSA